ncbi:E3 ubiquitin-protein ligase WAV3 [Neltuma alba]|uniref:E3 ubiquitin-protein ligase WAV3 n=1 Tax=Neltuma alba TaxID=207710 RepID=UPI0010A511CA|nr:E3 ubiquitin-protein ligase WAV3-like [Prosopis alba]
MGTGWRRAFCTRDPESRVSDKQQRSPSPSPRSCAKLGFFSSGSNASSTPRSQGSQPLSSPSLRCRTISEAAQTAAADDSPRFQCKNTTPKATKSPKPPSTASNPTSPRSPLKLSLFKNSFKFRSTCGLCLNSVKAGQGTAIYTAECSHAFHFPCIVAYVRKHGSLVCPLCGATWKDIPLLALHNNPSSESSQHNDIVAEKRIDDHPNASDDSRTENPSPSAFTTKNVEPPPQQRYQSKRSDSIRPYDDDEPLLSPTSGGQIITIPEADENCEDDDDVVEFQGFFVDPKTSSSIKSCSRDLQTKEESRNVVVKLVPECAIVSVSRSHRTCALVLKVKAPAARSTNKIASPLLDPSQRAPVDLVTVLDVSGSMAGAKLHMLKRAMRLVISSLGPADRLSIVAFSASAKRLLPLRRMSAQGQRAARRIIDRLVCGQGTCVGDALRKATKVLEDRRDRNPVASVMLLSDGQGERGQSGDPNNQRKGSTTWPSTRFAHIEIPVHAFGFGQNAGYSHEPAEDAFAKCVGGLLSVVVQDLRIQLGFQAGSAPAEISAVYSCSGRPTVLSSGSVRLGDLYAEEEREILVELRVPSSAYGAHHVMTVRCVFKCPATQEIVYGGEQSIMVPPPQTTRGSGIRIERLRNLFVTTRAIAESRRLTEHNDFTSAHHLLASTRALLMQSSSISADEFIRGLEAELAELHWRRQHQMDKIQQQQMMAMQRRRGSEREASLLVDEDGEPLTPTSAWRAAEKLAKMAMMKKSLNRVSDLHGFENARF